MIFETPNAEAVARAYTAELGRYLFKRPHDRGNMALHRRHFARPPTRGFWKRCRCFGCRMREANAPREKALATVLAKSYASLRDMADGLSIATASREDLERLSRVCLGGAP